MSKHIIATENAVVFDEAIGIHRQVIAGVRVPADLVAAYEARGAKQTGPAEAAGAKPTDEAGSKTAGRSQAKSKAPAEPKAAE